MVKIKVKPNSFVLEAATSVSSKQANYTAFPRIGDNVTIQININTTGGKKTKPSPKSYHQNNDAKLAAGTNNNEPDSKLVKSSFLPIASSNRQFHQQADRRVSENKLSLSLCKNSNDDSPFQSRLKPIGQTSSRDPRIRKSQSLEALMWRHNRCQYIDNDVSECEYFNSNRSSDKPRHGQQGFALQSNGLLRSSKQNSSLAQISPKLQPKRACWTDNKLPSITSAALTANSTNPSNVVMLNQSLSRSHFELGEFKRTLTMTSKES